MPSFIHSFIVFMVRLLTLILLVPYPPYTLHPGARPTLHPTPWSLVPYPPSAAVWVALAPSRHAGALPGAALASALAALEPAGGRGGV